MAPASAGLTEAAGIEVAGRWTAGVGPRRPPSWAVQIAGEIGSAGVAPFEA